MSVPFSSICRPAKNYYVCDVRGMRRKKKEGGNKEDGEGIEDTNEQFSFSSRGICYLDRNFLPFGRVRGEICQNWINETIMFHDGFFVEQIVQ